MPAAEQAAWRAFADELGLLFQVVDDILDGDGYVARGRRETARARLADEAAARAAGAARRDPGRHLGARRDRRRARRAHVVTRKRLDVLLVERGLAESRAQAQALVMAGLVPGHAKPGEQVDEDGAARRSSSRRRTSRAAGGKLANALDAFGVDPAGLDCLDLGASTGGFTDVLLQRGAARVIALDVGHGQLHPRIRDDPRVTVLERTNARALTALPFAPAARHLRRLVHLGAHGAAARARARGARLAGARPRQAAVRGRAAPRRRRASSATRAVRRRVLREVAEAALGWRARVAGRRRLGPARPEGKP